MKERKKGEISRGCIKKNSKKPSKGMKIYPRMPTEREGDAKERERKARLRSEAGKKRRKTNKDNKRESVWIVSNK